MTNERLQAARERACHHSVMKRLYDERTHSWTSAWVCSDCGYVLERFLGKQEQLAAAWLSPREVEQQL